MQIGFVTANYVARAADYRLQPFQWGAAERRTVEQMSLAHFDQVCADVAMAGFRYLEVWMAHAWPAFMTPALAAELRAVWEKHGLTGVGYAGGMGGAARNPEGARAKFAACKMLGLPVITGGIDLESAPLLHDLCREYGVLLAIENHPEKNPDEVIAKIGTYGAWIGAGVDTGWFATQGYPPADALKRLKGHLFHVHLKDVKAAGGHETVPLGTGVADIAACVRALKEIGYTGTVSIEHEPEGHDPTAECAEGLRYVEELLRG